MLIIYSIYGWGGPFIFTIILVIVTFIPATSKFLFQAEYSVTECSFAGKWMWYWEISKLMLAHKNKNYVNINLNVRVKNKSKFRARTKRDVIWKIVKLIFHIFSDNMALLLYFYGVVIIFLISNICLCICTARNIMYYEKDIANYLKNSKDQRYNDRKQW